MVLSINFNVSITYLETIQLRQIKSEEWFLAFPSECFVFSSAKWKPKYLNMWDYNSCSIIRLHGGRSGQDCSAIRFAEGKLLGIGIIQGVMTYNITAP
jgi:hypothetical protein